MFLIVGLGNPDKGYQNTYHNIGFMAVDKLASFFNAEFKKKKGNALIAETNFNGKKIVLAKPLTYMNNSGESVLKLVKFFKLDLSNLIVILDDIDLKRGVFRFRESGSGGTHNGLKNIVELLHTEDFKRIRIGIDRNPGDLANYVLSEISKDAHFEIDPVFDEVIKKVLEVINV